MTNSGLPHPPFTFHNIGVDDRDRQQNVSEICSAVTQPVSHHHDVLIATVCVWQHRLAQALAPIIFSGNMGPHDGNCPESPPTAPLPPTAPFFSTDISLERMINRIIIRLLWLRLCEDQGVIPQDTLLHFSRQPHAHQRCWQWFQQLTAANHDLLHTEDTSPWIRDEDLQPILVQLAHLSYHCYDPEVLLGKVYEYLLTNPQNKSHASSMPSPLSQPSTPKINGIYYTPTVVVENMVEQTLGRYCRESSPYDVKRVTILDPACGAGIFLVTAYRRLLQWYRQTQDHTDASQTALDILQRQIYGVDLDPQAVELTRLGLLLVLWNNEPSTQHSYDVDLSQNIQWGNTLIDVDISVDVGADAGVGAGVDISVDVGEMGGDRSKHDRSKHDHSKHDHSKHDRFKKEGDTLATTALGNAPTGGTLRHRLCPFNWPTAFPTIMEQGGFDIVLGNPPYVDAEWMTRHQPIERHYCASHYQTASGNWDLFCVFCEQALRLCKPNGLHSFIVPNKLAAADYAQATRTLLTVDNQLLYLRDYSQVPVFAIAVYPLVYVVRKTAPTAKNVEWERLSNRGMEQRTLVYATHFSQPQRPWAIASSPSLQTLITHIRHQGRPLGEIATVHGAATVAEAYAIKPLLSDAAEPLAIPPSSPAGLKFVNSGTIDPYQFLWGRKPLRYLKDRYQAPIIPVELAVKLPPKRLHQAHQPKIIVAGMTRGLECAVDRNGEFLPGKSTTVITSAIDLRYLAAILNSRLMNGYYCTEFGGNALNGGYLRIGPPQLKTLPIVVGSDRQFTTLTLLVDQLLQSQFSHADNPENTPEQFTILRQIDQQVCLLYGLSEEAMAVLNDSNL